MTEIHETRQPVNPDRAGYRIVDAARAGSPSHDQGHSL